MSAATKRVVELSSNAAVGHCSSLGTQLSAIVDAYTQRTVDEDIQKLDEHFGSVDDLLQALHTTLQNGIANEDGVRESRDAHGPNILPSKERTAFWKLVWEASADPMLRVLMCAAIISLVLGIAFGSDPKIEWIEGAAIFLAVCIVIAVTAINDYVKEKNFSSLYAQEVKYALVRRGGEQKQIVLNELVVGDVIQLDTGDEIPADALVLSAYGLRIDESSLTGESDLVSKATLSECRKLRQEKNHEIESMHQKNARHHVIPSPIVLSGTSVVAGSAHAVVVAVGVKSQTGKLFQKLAVDSEPTPLQNKLNGLARDVGRFGFIAALLTLIILVGEYWIAYGIKDPSERDTGGQIATTLIGFVVTAITIVVVAVPEGLPLAVTISLAFSVGRMLKDQNYVRRLAACETMGGANEVCTDKTGTLTKNQMEVEAFWNGLVLTADIDATNSSNISLPSGQGAHLLIQNIAVNSNSHLETTIIDIADGAGTQKEVIKQVGSPTECALIYFAERLGYDCKAIRAFFAGQSTFDENLIGNAEENTIYATRASQNPHDFIRFRIPFSSDRKVMLTAVEHPNDPELVRIFYKGAAEVIVRHCVLEDDDKTESGVIKHLASQALRTIALAYKDIKPSELDYDWMLEKSAENENFLKVEESGFLLLGIAGVRDPIREEVPLAVLKCQKAGIRVRMCTGDNLETAKQIAIKAHIYRPELGGVAILGPDFLKLVGGVVCQECGTAQCPCEVSHSGAAANGCEVAIPMTTASRNDEGIAEGGCCKRSRTRISSSGDKEVAKKKRVDVLGCPSAFEKLYPRLEVLARSQPNDKYALVTGLRNLGCVVAVTGDGTNDAPALKKADVGFAMGITGKEVAKQAADIVLLDDNFESIVRACKWGRNIYDNIQRFLQFQLTVNLVAVIVALSGALILRASPLSAVQLLWVNLIMDTLGALALATEIPTDNLLNRPPHKRDEYLINKTMFRNIVSQAIYMVVVLILTIFNGECWLPEWDFPYDGKRFPDFSPFETRCGNGRTVRSGRQFHPFSSVEDYKGKWFDEIGASRHYTYVFNIFVMMQVCNLVNARKTGAHEYWIFKGVLTNFYWIGILLFIIVGQVLLVQFGGHALAVHPKGLTWQQWAISICFGMGTWIVGFLAKLLPNQVVQWLPETANREVNPLDEPTSLALASRGRMSVSRLSARMNLSTGDLHSKYKSGRQ